MKSVCAGTAFDRHALVVETDGCVSYELIGFEFFAGLPRALGAVRWDRKTHGYQPDDDGFNVVGWPLVSLLHRADELRAGRIDHALSFVILPAARTIAEALKRHGMLLGDTGGTTSALMVNIEKSEDWTHANGTRLEPQLNAIRGLLTAENFEVLDTAPMRVNDESFQINEASSYGNRRAHHRWPSTISCHALVTP